MREPCVDCGYVHTTSDARAVGRFSNQPTTYAAAHAETPPRATREAAERDECQWRQSRPALVVAPAAVIPPAAPARPAAPKPPPSFPAAEMESAARAKAWLDFLAHVRLSLLVWEIDADVRTGTGDVMAWIRDCRDDLSGLVRLAEPRP